MHVMLNIKQSFMTFITSLHKLCRLQGPLREAYLHRREGSHLLVMSRNRMLYTGQMNAVIVVLYSIWQTFYNDS